MSHGNEKGEVIFSNGKLLKKDRIVAQFSSKYCEELYKKPKILYSKPVEAKQDELYIGSMTVTRSIRN